MLTPEREREIERICDAALERAIPEREAFLAEACAGDDSLRGQVESLLAQERIAASFLETPALKLLARGMGTERAALAVGRQIGSYTIVSPLGAGGMGEVYRAHDTTLRREVAIKVLPAIFTSDRERLARLEREARVLASLNHPNIATIHGVEHVDDIYALVLEVVEGVTLSDRLAAFRAGLHLADALGIARQLIEALGAAHETGIVHRDLKPANIKIRPDGVVKVLDFGLAKSLEPREDVPQALDLSPSPTLTGPYGRDRILLGTAAYMSPEQTRGEQVDKRTDIWAFGCVLYEMLAGRAPFAAGSITETLSDVLKTEPDWHRLPTDTPDSVRRLLRRCLAKDRARRLTDINDARLDLDEAVDVPTNARLSSRARRLETLSWVMALVLVTVLAASGIAWLIGIRTSSPPPQVRFEIESPPTAYPDTLAISPDGRKVVFAATADDGRSRLWLRWLDASSAHPLAGTEGGRTAFWSPDSQSIGFFANGSVKRMDVETGTVLKLGNAADLRSGTWSGDGTILFSPGTGSLLRISDRGGEAVAVSALSANGIALMHPRVLPDGRLLYDGGDGGATPRGIHVARLDGSLRRRIADGASAEYASPGYLLFTRDHTLLAQRFDATKSALAGSPVQVAEGVMALSVASNGALVFRSGVAPRRALLWFDRSGRELGRVPGPGDTPTISPDGSKVAVARVPPDRTTRPDIAIFDLARNVFGNVTAGRFANNSPLWSPDGTRIVFTSPRNRKPFALYLRPAAGGGDEQVLLELPQAAIPNAWSPDGRFLIYRRSSGTPSAQTSGAFDLWMLSLEDGRTFPLVQTEFSEREAQFSPDGRWFAYQSNESGRYEIYIKPFPDDGQTRHHVSRNGGVEVRWPRDGHELFYFGLDDTLMAVPIDTSQTGQTIKVGSPIPLFRANVGAGEGVGVQDYDVSRDGGRFLINTLQDVTAPITVILNWSPKEQER